MNRCARLVIDGPAFCRLADGASCAARKRRAKSGVVQVWLVRARLCRVRPMFAHWWREACAPVAVGFSLRAMLASFEALQWI
jgi:hypothetical protein